MDASPALTLATTTAQTFRFKTRKSVKVEVRFYTTAAALKGDEIAPGTGARDLVATTTLSVSGPGDYIDHGLTSGINKGTLLGAVGGILYEIELADGLSTINVAATPGSDPGGAVSYRILLDTEGVV